MDPFAAAESMDRIFRESVSPINNLGQGLLGLAVQRRAGELSRQAEIQKQQDAIELERIRNQDALALETLRQDKANQSALDKLKEEYRLKDVATKETERRDMIRKANEYGADLKEDATYDVASKAFIENHGQSYVQAMKGYGAALHDALTQTGMDPKEYSSRLADLVAGDDGVVKALTPKEREDIRLHPEKLDQYRKTFAEKDHKKYEALASAGTAAKATLNVEMDKLALGRPAAVAATYRLKQKEEQLASLRKAGGFSPAVEATAETGFMEAAYPKPAGDEQKKPPLPRQWDPTIRKWVGPTGAPLREQAPPPGFSGPPTTTEVPPPETGAGAAAAPAAPAVPTPTAAPEVSGGDADATLQNLIRQEAQRSGQTAFGGRALFGSSRPINDEYLNQLATAIGINPGYRGSSRFHISPGATLMQGLQSDPSLVERIQSLSPSQRQAIAQSVLTKLSLNSFMQRNAATQNAVAPTAFRTQAVATPPFGVSPLFAYGLNAQSGAPTGVSPTVTDSTATGFPTFINNPYPPMSTPGFPTFINNPSPPMATPGFPVYQADPYGPLDIPPRAPNNPFPPMELLPR